MPEPPERSAYPPAYRANRPYYGSGTGSAGFRGIGGDLLKTFPPITSPPAIDPTAPGFASHGSQLLAPMRDGPGGSRIAACPVCLAHAIMPRTAGGWMPFRCESCGTECVATDGSPPPKLPPPPPSAPEPLESSELVVPIMLKPHGRRAACCPVCHSLKAIAPDAGGWVELRCLACGTEFSASDGTAPPPKPTSPPPPVPASPPPPPSLPRSTLVFDFLGDHCCAVCPVCDGLVTFPRHATGEVRLLCSACATPFVATAAKSKAPPPPPPPPPRLASFWGKVSAWFVVLLLCSPLLLGVGELLRHVLRGVGDQLRKWFGG